MEGGGNGGDGVGGGDNSGKWRRRRCKWMVIEVVVRVVVVGVSCAAELAGALVSGRLAEVVGREGVRRRG